MVQTTQGRIGGPPSGGRDAPGLAFPGIKSAGGNVKDVPTVPESYFTPSGGARGTASAAAGRSRRPRARDATILYKPYVLSAVHEKTFIGTGERSWW